MAAIDGMLLVRPAARLAEASGYFFDAKWRDAGRRQVKRVIGPAWVEVHGDGWRKRRGVCPPGYYLPNDALVRMRELIDEHEAGRVQEQRVADAAGIFDNVAELWLDYGAGLGDWKPKTAVNYRSIVRAHLLPAFGGKHVNAITDDEVRRWWQWLHSPKREGGPLSNRNANAILAALRSMLNWAVDEKLLIANPALGFRKHREKTADKAPFYTVAEVRQLVAAAERLHREMAADPARRERSGPSRHDGVIFLVAAFTGLRRAEVISLRWRDVDFERRSIYVIENVSAGIDARVKDDEGRTVPLASAIRDALLAIRPEDARPDDLIFSGLLGQKLDADALSSRFEKAREAAGIRPLRLHDLRHTFGSLAIDGNASIVQVKEWMGHSDIKTTMRYLHTMSRDEDADLLDVAFAG